MAAQDPNEGRKGPEPPSEPEDQEAAPAREDGSQDRGAESPFDDDTPLDMPEPRSIGIGGRGGSRSSLRRRDRFGRPAPSSWAS